MADADDKDFDLRILAPGSLGRIRASLGDRAFPMGDRAFPIGDRGFPMGDHAFPMGDHAFPMGANPRPTLVVGTGYHSDLPDARDYERSDIADDLRETHSQAVRKSHLLQEKIDPKKFPGQFDLRIKEHVFVPWPVENQGLLQSCTAHAVVGLIEFLIRQGCKDVQDLSRLFLYKVTRQFLGWAGDSGASIRSSVRCAGIFGMPPEEYWPYDISAYDVEPSPFLFSFAHSYRALKYARLDGYGDSGEKTLDHVKCALLDRFPVAFGFPVYSSVTKDASIPLPDPQDKLVGGHAILAVGFDDDHVNGVDPENGYKPSKPGALIFRNSWGPQWGKDGYGYLPYQYVQRQLAVDFWTIYNQSWLNNKQFGAPVDGSTPWRPPPPPPPDGTRKTGN